MDRIEELELLGATPEYFAYSARHDGNNLTNHEFERIGGGRSLKHCEWNLECVNNLEEEEFKKILAILNVRNYWEEQTRGLTLLEFFEFFSKQIKK